MKSLLRVIKRHPQRTSGFMIQLFGAIQMVLAAFQAHIDPLVNGAITATFGGLVSMLAWVQKNTKDKV